MIKCPKEVRRAVKALARAVKMVSDLADLPQPDPLTEYHAKAYLEEMETMLVHQLLTSFSDEEEREDILSGAGLDYLAEDVQLVEKDWNRD